jgi:hypothetical protein
MRRPLPLVPLVALLVGLAGPWLCACAGSALGGYRVSPARVGAVYPSKGEACDIRFENLTFLEGASKYEQLGLVSVTGTGSDELTDPMKHDVQVAACKMGGDAVSLNASAPGMIQFLVWRAR